MYKYFGLAIAVLDGMLAHDIWRQMTYCLTADEVLEKLFTFGLLTFACGYFLADFINCSQYEYLDKELEEIQEKINELEDKSNSNEVEVKS